MLHTLHPGVRQVSMACVWAEAARCRALAPLHTHNFCSFMPCTVRQFSGNSYLRSKGKQESHRCFVGMGRSMSRALATSIRCQATTSIEPASASPADVAKLRPPFMSGAEIREQFLQFYESKGHKRLPSSSLVPEDPTVLLTIAGMLQFKPIFLGQVPRQYPRATTAQKCIRTNDVENVGVTTRHHTFFEMLGNFSFGDYFKPEAVAMAWELSTGVYRLPPERVWVSVYEHDDEAYALWRDKVGVPEARIQRLGADDNFWSSGPTGPCGPCTELYYDFHPERGLEGASLEDDSRFAEFLNVVFMESNRSADGSLEPLAVKNIDTGMGLERMAQILQAVPNNYETDLLMPIMEEAAALAGLRYGAADARAKAALKVVADHCRAVTYLLSDGVLPSNVGRGYVLRRLLRRAVMKGRLLGINEQFLHKVAAVAVDLSEGCDPQVVQNASRIDDEIKREEGRFVDTLEAGQKRLADILAACEEGGCIGGADAFMLYDTYGFPLEITQEIAADRGISVDEAGFAEEMAVQRQRSKDSARQVDLTAEESLGGLAAQLGPTAFLGYGQLEARARVLTLLRDGMPVEAVSEGEEVRVVLDQTPFYAQSGGQVGDHGLLRTVAEEGGGSSAVLRVTDCGRGAGGALSLHSALVQSGELRQGQLVTATVDAGLRLRARAHHTATHLLQAALKEVLGADVSQQGSLVDFDRLRFDFNLPRAMTESEVRRVEGLVNGWVQDSRPLQTREMALADARAAGAVAMFGEKYGETVRVVEVAGVSMELCGGTHVDDTAQIAVFKVLSESGIASGVRRIEAVAGPAAVEHLDRLDGVVRELGGQLRVAPSEMPARVAGLLEEVRALQKSLAEAKAAAALAQAASLASRAETLPSGARVLVARLGEVDAKALQEAAVSLRSTLGDPAAVVLFSQPESAKVSMVAAFSPAVTKKGGLAAGKFIGGLAKLCGGGGGGKPELAQAGGKDPTQVEAAMEAARRQLAEALS